MSDYDSNDGEPHWPDVLQCPDCNIIVEPGSSDTSKCVTGYETDGAYFNQDEHYYINYCCNCGKTKGWSQSKYNKYGCAGCKARATGGQRAASHQTGKKNPGTAVAPAETTGWEAFAIVVLLIFCWETLRSLLFPA